MARSGRSSKGVESYLLTLGVDELVALLVDAAQWHEPLRQRPEAEAAAASARSGELSKADVKKLKAVLEDLILPYGSFVPYRATGSWARTAGSSDEVLQEVLAAGQWEAGIELAEPIRLASVVFEWEMSNDYGLLDDVFGRYTDVLGPRGLEAIGALIAPRLARAAAGHDDFAIRHLAEKFAEATGTLDDVIAVLAQDLSSGYQYLRIAERLASARESAHPADAIPIYVRKLEATIDAKNNDAYADAVKQLRHLQTLDTNASQPERFHQLIASVRTRHKPKRNLMALLDKAVLD